MPPPPAEPSHVPPERPLVSVIVPVYKVEKYLPRCLESIAAQTYPNLDIILVDDGSPDACGGMCDRFAQEHANVRVLHQANQGETVDDISAHLTAHLIVVGTDEG